MTLENNRKALSTKEKKLIDNIKNSRRNANITQEKLSALLNRNSNYIGMVESYRRGVSLKTLFKIATALQIKVEKLFENI